MTITGWYRCWAGFRAALRMGLITVLTLWKFKDGPEPRWALAGLDGPWPKWTRAYGPGRSLAQFQPKETEIMFIDRVI